MNNNKEINETDGSNEENAPKLIQTSLNSSQRLKNLSLAGKIYKPNKINLRPYYFESDWEEFKLKPIAPITATSKKIEHDEKLPKDHFISVSVLNFIAKSIPHPNIETLEIIDHYLNTLAYFTNLSLETRYQLYQESAVVVYEINQYIFYQNDDPDYFYVVLRGACSVEVKSKSGGGKPYVVTTFYDGQHFGDVAANKSTGVIKRTASIRCSENSYLLRVPLDVYNRVIFFPNQADFDKRYPVIITSKFFKLLSNKRFDLVLRIWVRNSKRMLFNHNDKIISQGEKPKGLYLIVNGYCNVIYENNEKRSFTPSKFCRKSIIPQPRNFLSLVKQNDSHRGEFKCSIRSFSAKRRSSTHENKTYQMKEVEEKSEFIKNVYKVEEIQEKGFKFNDQLIIGKREKGDVFCGYSLLDGVFGTDVYDEVSTFSIIAATIQVEIYFFPKHLVSYFTHEMKELLLISVQKHDLENKKNSLPSHKNLVTTWHNFKIKYAETHLKERHRHRERQAGSNKSVFC